MTDQGQKRQELTGGIKDEQEATLIDVDVVVEEECGFRRLNRDSLEALKRRRSVSSSSRQQKSPS